MALCQNYAIFGRAGFKGVEPLSGFSNRAGSGSKPWNMTGWWLVSTPLKNMSSSVGMIIPNPIFLGKYRIHGSTIHHQTWWSMSLVKGHQFLERNLWSWRLPDFSSGNWTMSVRPDVRPTELLRWKANMFLGHHKVMRSIPWMDTWMGISLKYPSGFS